MRIPQRRPNPVVSQGVRDLEDKKENRQTLSLAGLGPMMGMGLPLAMGFAMPPVALLMGAALGLASVLRMANTNMSPLSDKVAEQVVARSHPVAPGSEAGHLAEIKKEANMYALQHVGDVVVVSKHSGPMAAWVLDPKKNELRYLLRSDLDKIARELDSQGRRDISNFV
jgi:hypothetical protein